MHWPQLDIGKGILVGVARLALIALCLFIGVWYKRQTHTHTYDVDDDDVWIQIRFEESREKGCDTVNIGKRRQTGIAAFGWVRRCHREKKKKRNWAKISRKQISENQQASQGNSRMASNMSSRMLGNRCDRQNRSNRKYHGGRCVLSSVLYVLMENVTHFRLPKEEDGIVGMRHKNCRLKKTRPSHASLGHGFLHQATGVQLFQDSRYVWTI